MEKIKLLRIGNSCGEIFTLLKNIDDVRRFVDNNNVIGKKIIGDLSNLSQDAQSVLLKFIEEGVDEITCFASRDNVNPVLMSRFDKIERFEEIKIGMDSFSNFVLSLEDADYKYVSLEKEFIAKSAGFLDSYMVYKKLPKGVCTRIGRFI